MALRSGILSDRFESLSIKEIYDELEAYNQNRTEQAKVTEEQNKFLLIVAHKQAEWNSFAFGDPKKMPTLRSQFPDYFSEEEKPAPRKNRKSKVPPIEQWQIDKMRFDAFAAAHNNQVAKKEE